MPAATLDIAERLYSAEELMALPRDARFELVEGRLRQMSPTSGEHGEKTNRLGTYLSVYIYDHDLGDCFAAETGFLLSRGPDVVLAPDFAFVAKARLTYTRGEGYVPIAPDLVVETRSPSDRPRMVADKVAMWLSYGVGIVIDVDPRQRNLTIHRPVAEPLVLGSKDTFEGFDALPGFVLPLSRLF